MSESPSKEAEKGDGSSEKNVITMAALTVTALTVTALAPGSLGHAS
jgi:hypothetical protein